MTKNNCNFESNEKTFEEILQEELAKLESEKKEELYKEYLEKKEKEEEEDFRFSIFDNLCGSSMSNILSKTPAVEDVVEEDNEDE